MNHIDRYPSEQLHLQDRITTSIPSIAISLELVQKHTRIIQVRSVRGTQRSAPTSEDSPRTFEDSERLVISTCQKEYPFSMVSQQRPSRTESTTKTTESTTENVQYVPPGMRIRATEVPHQSRQHQLTTPKTTTAAEQDLARGYPHQVGNNGHTGPLRTRCSHEPHRFEGSYSRTIPTKITVVYCCTLHEP